MNMAFVIGAVIVIACVFWWFARRSDDRAARNRAAPGDKSGDKRPPTVDQVCPGLQEVARENLASTNAEPPRSEDRMADRPVLLQQAARGRDYSQWPQDSAFQRLLAEFIHPRVQQGAIMDYWQSTLGEPPQRVVDSYVESGLLIPSSQGNLGDAISTAFSVDQLKELLRERHLKLSGNKSVLISRLITADEPRMREIIRAANYIELAPQIKPLAECFTENRKVEQKRAISTSLSALRDGRFAEAVTVMADYQKAQTFQRGIGLDWSEDSLVVEYAETMSLIFSSLPKILKPYVQEEQLPGLRLAAAIDHLWGSNRLHREIENLPENYGKFSQQEAISVFSHFAYEASRLRNFRADGIRHIEVYGDEQTACAACKKIIGKRYSIGRIPELPPPRCTCLASLIRYHGDYRELCEQAYLE